MTRRLLTVTSTLVLLAVTAPGAAAAVSVGHSGWEWGNPSPQGQTIQALEFEGARGYAAGWFGTLLSTEDGGTTWRGSSTGLTVPLDRISLIDSDSFVVGGECALRRSDDGGQTFTRLPWTATDLRCAAKVAAFDFPSDQAGFVVLEDGSVLGTADGGRTWSRETSLPVTQGAVNTAPSDVTFLTPSTGVAVSRSGRIYRTTDAASSWSLVHGGSSILTGVHFASELVGYAVGTFGIVLGTIDGGQTWTPKPNPGVNGLQGIRCATPLDCLVTTDTQTVLRTTNGAATWSAVTPATQKIMAAAFSSSTNAVAAGEAGITVLSSDTGATWQPVGKRLAASFERIRALSPSVAFAMGPEGALARTTDGGVTGPRSACRRRRT